MARISRRLRGPGAHQVGDPAGERARLARAGARRGSAAGPRRGSRPGAGARSAPRAGRRGAARWRSHTRSRIDPGRRRPAWQACAHGALRRGAARRARRSPRTPARCRSTSTRLGRGRAGPAAGARPRAPLPRGLARGRGHATLLTLDSINFGSGWFPTLRKRPGCSGYFTVAWALADRFRSDGPWSAPELRGARRAERSPAVLGQERGHELMAPLRPGAERPRRVPRRALARWTRSTAADGSAERLAEQLAAGMPFFDDPGFYKRAQIVPNDLALAGRGRVRRPRPAHDLRRQPRAARAAGGRGAALRDGAGGAASTPASCCQPGREEREIRACAVHACELIAGRLGVPPRVLDTWLWNRGQEPRYKARPAAPHADGLLLTALTAPAAGRLAARGRAAAARERSRALGALAGQLGDHALELVHPRGQPAEGVGHRVGQVGPVGVRALAGACRPPAPGGRGCRPRWSWPARRGSPRSWRRSSRRVAHLDRAEQLGAGADHHVVPHGGVALAALEAGAAQRHALVERHVRGRSRRSRRSRLRRRGR